MGIDGKRRFDGVVAHSLLACARPTKRPEGVKDDSGMQGEMQPPNAGELGRTVGIVFAGFAVGGAVGATVSAALGMDISIACLLGVNLGLLIIPSFFKIYQG